MLLLNGVSYAEIVFHPWNYRLAAAFYVLTLLLKLFKFRIVANVCCTRTERWLPFNEPTMRAYRKKYMHNGVTASRVWWFAMDYVVFFLCLMCFRLLEKKSRCVCEVDECKSPPLMICKVLIDWDWLLWEHKSHWHKDPLRSWRWIINDHNKSTIYTIVYDPITTNAFAQWLCGPFVHKCDSIFSIWMRGRWWERLTYMLNGICKWQIRWRAAVTQPSIVMCFWSIASCGKRQPESPKKTDKRAGRTSAHIARPAVQMIIACTRQYYL